MFFDLSDVIAQGYSASDMKVSTTYMQHAVKISEFKESDTKGIYYIDLNLDGAKIYPGGQSECKCELQIRVSAPGKWDYSKSPCVAGLGGTSNSQMTAPSGMQLFEGSKLVIGEGYAPEPVQDPDPTPVPDPTPTPDPEPIPDPDPTPTPDPEPVPDPDPTPTQPGELTADYTVNNWGSGYQVIIKVENNSDTTVDGWTVKVKKSEVTIDSSWCVKVAESGDYYVITPEAWNSTLQPGSSTEFGIQGAGSVSESISVTVE
jgi:cellulase/cellobiase CelA1